MQRFQQSFNAFIEQFQQRWETQPAFRATWSTLGVGTFLIILCIGALVGSNLLGGFFASAGDVSHGSVLVAGNGKTSTFPLNQLTPQGNDASGTKPTPVATSTYSPSPTPTVTPSGPTPVPSPADTGTPTENTFTVTASQQGQWKVGQFASITDFATTDSTTTKPIPSVTMTLKLQFGTDQNCKIANPISVPIDANGTHKNPISFTVPTCTKGSQVTATYHIDGYSDFIDSGRFVVTG